MRNLEASAADTAETERAALCAQLATVDEAVRRVLAILAGVLLSLLATLAQRGYLARLICGAAQGESPPDTTVTRAAGALLVLSSLFFFTRLSHRTLCDAETEDAVCAADIDYKGNLLVLSVALARLWLLLREACRETGARGETDARGESGARGETGAR